MTEAGVGIGRARSVRSPGIFAPNLMQRARRPGVLFTLLPAALAWATLAAMPLAHLDLQICATLPGEAAAALRQAFDLQWVGFRPGLALMEWSLMVFAMMLPLMASEVDHVRARVFARDRNAVMVALIVGYVGAWLAMGPVAILATMVVKATLQAADPIFAAPVIPLGLGALWMLSRTRLAMLYRCHYRPVLPAGGRAAWAGAWAQGLGTARFCLASCLPLMLAMQVAGGGLWGMALLALLLSSERLSHRSDPRDAAILLAIFGVYLTLI